MPQDERPRKHSPRAKNASPWIASANQAEEELDDLQQQLIAGVCQALDCEAGAFLLLRELQGELTVRKASVKGSIHLPVEMDRDAGLIEQSLRQKLSILVNDRDAIRAGFSPVIPHLPVNAFVAVPLWVDEIPFGAVVAINPNRGQFTKSDQDLLEHLALPLAHALFNLLRAQRQEMNTNGLETNIAQLTRSRNMLRTLFDNISLSIYIIDPQLQPDRRQPAARPALQPRPQSVGWAALLPGVLSARRAVRQLPCARNVERREKH